MKKGEDMRAAVLLLVPVMAVLAGCQRPVAEKAAVAPAAAILIEFVEREENIDPYRTRVIVTRDFMRFDDGEGSEDFVLFDRRSRLIFSVNAEDRSVMIVEPQNRPVEPPIPLQVEARNLGPMKGAPAINGVVPVHHQVVVNGEVCYDTVSVAGLMEDVVAALREFRLVLASDAMLTANTIPADVRDPCSLAMTTFAPNRELAFGFPIQEWGRNGYARTLVDYREDYEPEPGLFAIPSDYRRFTVQEIRAGGGA